MTERHRFVRTFVVVCIAAVFVHEIGHAVAGWVQGIPIVPTPAKTYILRDQVELRHQTWISLGGVAATTMLVLGTLVWYARVRPVTADAVLAGVLVPLAAYSLRFLILGRGHDGLEWQQAQSAAGADPSGHAVDLLFLTLLLVGGVVWVGRRRSSLRVASFARAGGLLLGGIALVVVLQVGNNQLFDPLFPKPRATRAPSGSFTVAGADSVTVQFDVRIPMRDGVTLSADVYRPAAPGRYPVVLMRTPYNKNGDAVLKEARAFAGRGYVYVAVDVRGRGDSDGEWRPYFFEGDDGYDAIEWCAAQGWSTGKIGTIGRSYVGYNQWLAAVRRPPHLAAIIALAPMADPFEDVWISGPGGLPTPTMISWYHLTARHVMQNMDAVDWDRLNWHLPLLTMDEAAGRGPNPRWRDIITHSTRDHWWDPLRYQDRLEKVVVPALHITGWYDDTQRATPMNYIGMRTRAATAEARDRQKLVIGPWPHAINSTRQLGRLDFGPTAVIDLFGLQVEWFDRWLKGKSPPKPDHRVHLFAMQTNQWFTADDWPIPGTAFTKYYLRAGGQLTTADPGDEQPDQYRYDPADPTPFLTEPSFAQLGGPDDYAGAAARKDLLNYTTARFDTAALVCGPISARIFAASSATDTDFMVKLLDVWPDGYVQRLNDGMVRARFRNGWEQPGLIEPGKVYQYDIDVWSTCQTILPGHRLRVEVASSAFPKFDRNPNTGEPLGLSARLQVADQTVYHDRARASYVVLPFAPRVPTSP